MKVKVFRFWEAYEHTIQDCLSEFLEGVDDVKFVNQSQNLAEDCITITIWYK